MNRYAFYKIMSLCLAIVTCIKIDASIVHTHTKFIDPKMGPDIFFNHDGSKMAVSDIDAVRIFDTKTKALIYTFPHFNIIKEGHSLNDLTKTVSKKNPYRRAYKTTSGDKVSTIGIFSPDNVHTELSLRSSFSKRAEYYPLAHVDFSPDGEKILITSVNTVFVYELATGNKLSEISDDNDIALYAVFSPDGNKILTIFRSAQKNLFRDNKGKAVMWNLQTNTQDYIIPLSHSILLNNHFIYRRPVFSPDGKMVIVNASAPYTGTIYDVSTGEKICAILQRGPFSEFLFSDDSKYAFSINHLNVTASNPTSGKRCTLKYSLPYPEYEGRQTPIHLNSNKSKFTAALPEIEHLPDPSRTDGKRPLVRLYDVYTGAIESSFETDEEHEASRYYPSPDGMLILRQKWNDPKATPTLLTRDGKKISDLAHSKPITITDPFFSPDSSKIFMITGSIGSIIDAHTGTIVNEYNHKQPITSAQFSPDGKNIAIATAGSVYLWPVKINTAPQR